MCEEKENSPVHWALGSKLYQLLNGPAGHIFWPSLTKEEQNRYVQAASELARYVTAPTDTYLVKAQGTGRVLLHTTSLEYALDHIRCQCAKGVAVELYENGIKQVLLLGATGEFYLLGDCPNSTTVPAKKPKRCQRRKVIKYKVVEVSTGKPICPNPRSLVSALRAVKTYRALKFAVQLHINGKRAPLRKMSNGGYQLIKPRKSCKGSK